MLRRSCLTEASPTLKAQKAQYLRLEMISLIRPRYSADSSSNGVDDSCS
jgi:hypothetical protein